MSLKSNLKRVEKSYISDLENILRDISCKFNIYDKDSEILLSEDDLINMYIVPMIEQEKQYQCSAILINGNRCSHKRLKETRYKYCKKHLFKDNLITKQHKDFSFQDNETNHLSGININTGINIVSSNDGMVPPGLHKHFINDKLYYIDEKYIYNCDGISKAGYLEKDDINVNYILIDDPFILQNI